MSGHECETAASGVGIGTVGRRPRVEGRVTLIGVLILNLGGALIGLAPFEPLRLIGAVAFIVGSVLQMLCWPQEFRRVLTPRTVRQIARIAEVPELPTIIVVSSSVVAGLAGAIAILAHAI